MEHICVSKGNRKMGAIPSVSLPPVKTCPHHCEHCYAEKMCRIYPNVRESYERNLRIWKEDPERYWKEVCEAMATSRFFRLDVSGDFPSYEYFCEAVESARKNPKTDILAFTKRYSWVNRWIDENGDLPENLHIIFSDWKDFPMENPHNLPVAYVRYKDGFCNAGENAVECFGNCFECFIAGCGCWKLGKGEAVVFNEH